MLFHQISALLFTLFAAAAVAGGKKSRSGHPQATCLIHQKTNYRDTYIIRGRNWNITEADFISAINSGGTVLSAWERMEGIDYDDAHVFKAKCKIPISEVRKTKKKLGKLVEPFPFKTKCWKPHESGDIGNWKPSNHEDFLTGGKPRHYTC